jgi:PAS domain S-box-containing protein
MRVQASMVISLLQKDRLWGLIACHHMAPKRVSIAMREATIFISRMISSKLGLLQINEERRLLDQAARIKTELLKIILSHSAGDILQQLSDDLLKLMDASGMVVVVEGKRYIYGEGLLPNETDNLIDWLATLAPANAYSCDYLAKVFPAAEAYQSLVSGLITTAITSDMRNIIVWLRKDKPRSVNWAGVYEEGLVKTHAGGYRLNPRTSFELWTEMWSGRCTPWKAVEIDIAHSLGQVLSDGLAEKNRNAIINNMPALIAYWQKNLLNVFSNQTFAKAFDVKFESLQGSAFKDVVSLEFFKQSQKSIDKVLQGIPSKIEYDVYDQAKNSVSHFLMEFVPNRIKHEIQGFYTIGFDITERKVIESQLKASELRFRNLANHVPVLIWTSSDAKKTVWFNNRWLVYTGRTLEDATNTGWQDAFHPEDLPRYLQLLNCQLNTDASHIECRIRKHDGQYYWYDCYSIPLVTFDNELDGYLGVCIDLTQLRLSEKAIADAEKERYLRAELIQFIAMIGHELRTPLAIIDATVKSLGILPGADCLDVMIRHQHIIHSVKRLENLVTNVLARDRFESGAWRLTRHTWPLFELMDSVLATYQHALPENVETGDVSFQLDIPERVNSCLSISANNYYGLISGDFQFFQIALSNLIDNACKYGDIDSVIKINCEIGVSTVDIAVLNQGNQLEDQDLKRVFDKYWRGDESTGVAGAGLGLYLVKHIVELHDGTIQVNNLSGRWIEFKMTLPLRPSL